jgi:serine/threonine protein kinase
MSAYALNPGTIVAGFRIDRAIGHGGMGSVYEATQLSLDRAVVLKVIAAEYGDDADFRERFRREGRIQARIDHPHIIPIYDAGESEHGLYLAMRLVRGENLFELLAGGRLDVQETLHLLGQAAAALDAAHEVGLIHRDVKPHNILVERRRAEHAYLADFGITKSRDEANLTQTGLLIGTIDYMSPEQIMGRGAAEASDVYAFGCVFYECLTGSVPFPREENVAVMYAHVSEAPPSVGEHRSDLPAAIDEVIARALAKEPEQRYATATELVVAAAAALEAADGVGSLRHAVAPRRKRRSSVRRQLAQGLAAAGARLAAEPRSRPRPA